MRHSIPEELLTSDALASAALIAILLLARLIAGRALRQPDNLSPQATRRWTANVRNLLLLVAVIGLIMIWAPQLRTFALSLTAVAVALVVATKELILCLSGSALRTFTRAYSVGDFVEIGTTRGEVADYNLMATSILEFESHDGSIQPTGRRVIIPHSLLFTTPAKVLGQTGGKMPHRFQLVFEPDLDLFSAKDEIENAAGQALEGLLPEEKSEVPSSEKRVKIGIGTSDIGKLKLEVMILVHPAVALDAENGVTCAIGTLVQDKRAQGTHSLA